MRARGIAAELGLYLLAGLCFVGALGPAPAPHGLELVPRASGVWRVATWNVGAGLAGRGGLRDASLEHVARTLRRIDPDLAVLQELTGLGQLARLLDLLGDGWVGEVAPGAGSLRVAAVAQRGRLARFDVGVSGRALGLRYASEGRGELVIVGLHADAFSAAARNRQIGAAASALRAQPAGGGRLLLGDLNLDLDVDKRQDLFTDDEHRDVETYNFLARDLVDVGLGSGPTAEPDRRLDYVFAAAGTLTAVRAGPLLDSRAEGMDHHPLVADLRPLR